MRVFVAGASGVIGRRLVPMLVQAGHEVTGTTRTASNVEFVRDLGATPVVCDVLDSEAVRKAVEGARPEAIVHQATQIPAAIEPRRYAEQLAVTNRLRTEGTTHLIEAGRAVGGPRLVAQSIAFAYAPHDGRLAEEDDPLYVDAPDPLRVPFQAIAALERAVTGTDGIDGVVLRYGFFYGPRTPFAGGGSTAEAVRKRRLPVVGGGTGVWSFIHVDDAAAGTVAALPSGGGIYNVVDDEPAPASDWIPRYAEVLHAKAPLRVPKIVGRLAGGPFVDYYMTQLRGASNSKAKRELDWEPRYPSWREGFRESVGARP